MQSTLVSPIETIPEPEVVRRELSSKLRDTRLLRALLKLSEEKARLSKAPQQTEARK